MKRIHFLYRTTNIVNCKKYYGKHSTYNINDGYLGSGVLLSKAIKKYGKENFIRDILILLDSIDELNKFEELFITKDLVCRTDTYNIAVGGAGGHLGSEWYTKHKEAVTKPEYKEKMSKLKAGKRNGFYGKSHSQEVIEHLRILNSTTKPSENYEYHRSNFRGDGNPFYGHNHTNETKAIISNKKSKPISIDGVDFKSTKEAFLKIGMSTINYRLKSKNFNNYKYL